MFLQTIVKQRNQLLQTIRDFFQNRGYLEVETPLCVPSPGMEPNLSPIEVKIKDVCGKTFQAGLITSPEYSMKKLLGHGFEKIFTITKVFRNEEPFDETHNIEFTMLEWYCQGKNYKDCMDETEDLIKACALAFMSSKAHPSLSSLINTTWKRISLQELFFEQFGFDLGKADKNVLQLACQKNHLQIDSSDTESDYFYRLFLKYIEPSLKDQGPIFIYDYPRYQAALSALTTDGYFGQRFELYIDGLELCNGFTELTDNQEQRKRFNEEAQERLCYGKQVFPIDEELLNLLPSIHSPTFGNALGVERLHMALAQACSISDVILFPTSTLFR